VLRSNVQHSPGLPGARSESEISTLGFSLSDRVGRILTWWHCDAHHHGVAAAAGSPLLDGLARHGPRGNHHIYSCAIPTGS
jgi:hypothetical protein